MTGVEAYLILLILAVAIYIAWLHDREMRGVIRLLERQMNIIEVLAEILEPTDPPPRERASVVLFPLPRDDAA